MLETLYINNTHLSSRATVTLFNIVKENTKLKVLNIINNDVTNAASDAITTALGRNNCLVRLYMYNNPLTGEAIVKIVDGLKGNVTLGLLGLPACPEDFEKRVSSLQEAINGKRESQGCKVKLKINYL